MHNSFVANVADQQYWCLVAYGHTQTSNKFILELLLSLLENAALHWELMWHSVRCNKALFSHIVTLKQDISYLWNHSGKTRAWTLDSLFCNNYAPDLFRQKLIISLDNQALLTRRSSMTLSLSCNAFLISFWNNSKQALFTEGYPSGLNLILIPSVKSICLSYLHCIYRLFFATVCNNRPILIFEIWSWLITLFSKSVFWTFVFNVFMHQAVSDWQ